MLTTLYLKNFAIIEEISLSFYDNFTVITGETGAGKSIIANALIFLSGHKFDENILKDKTQKTIVEAIFTKNIEQLTPLLQKHDISPNTEIIVRRELLPSGTSRQYVNDTVVNVSVLKEITSQLFDIHSQHQNILLKQSLFQLQIIDNFANIIPDINQYKTLFKQYKDCKHQLQSLLAIQKEEQQKADYLLYQQKEFEALTLSADEFAELETEFQSLEHAEELLEKLNEAHILLNETDHSLTHQTKQIYKILQNISAKLTKAQIWSQRIDSILNEIKDVDFEIQKSIDTIQSNPEKFSQLQSYIDSVYKLMHKYKLHQYNELLELKQSISEKLSLIQNLDSQIDATTHLCKELENKVIELAHSLHEKRMQAAKHIQKPLEQQLKTLGMPHAQVLVNVNKLLEPTEMGISSVTILFSANSKQSPQPIDKIASGGELSRVLLTLKSLNYNNSSPYTLLLDEADTGISGEIAFKAGSLMKQMASQRQIIAITHLPQVAACGYYHLCVIKKNTDKGTTVIFKYLTPDERINEIAKLISADKITDSAIEQAKHLINVSTTS
ncbi:MAG: DNA repair protein RecN [Bacteroidales bacterium]|nr:DNA repair protein RecN [Bacteroidales bacterium]